MEPSAKTKRGLSRRTVTAGLAAAALASACRMAGVAKAASFPPPTLDRLTLDRFMALSEKLVGVEGLDRRFGARLLEALTADAGTAETLGALVETHLEDGARQESGGATARMAALEQDLRAAWWSGVFASPNGRVVYAYEDALYWRALPYATPAGFCGGDFGAWADPPAG